MLLTDYSSVQQRSILLTYVLQLIPMRVCHAGVRYLGGPTALPCSLPGLSLNPDSLAVLIGELILDKITSDNYTDAHSAVTAAGPSSQDGSAVYSEDGIKAKGAAAVKAWWTARNRRDLEGTVYDFFMTK